MSKSRLKWGIMFAKVFAIVLAVGSLYLMGYAARDHYHTQHVCSCVRSWEVVPFIVGGLAILFALSLLALKETEGAAAVVLPFVKEIRLGRRDTDAFAVVAPPAVDPSQLAPVLAPSADEDKP